MEETQISPAESFNDMCEEESVMESLCAISGGGGATDPEESDANVEEIDVDFVPKSPRGKTSTEATDETVGAELARAKERGAEEAEDSSQSPGEEEAQAGPMVTVGATCSDTIVFVPSESGSSTAEGERQ